MSETILPGTYITVRDEGLISAGPVASGNIGIVGTASKGPVDEVAILGSFSEAKEAFGESDGWIDGASRELTLIRALEYVYQNGGKTVYAVRTAKASARSAAFQTRAGDGTTLVKLEAKTPGTWGNEIKICISDAEEPALVTDRLAGDVRKLNRTQVRANSSLNSVVVQQKSTGLTLQYSVVYDSPPDDTKPQVRINAADGALVFTALAGYAPTAADTIIARYEVVASHSKKVELTHQSIKEVRTVADASHLAELVNQKSSLVTAPAAAQTAFYDRTLKNTDGLRLFGTGQEGHSAGGNGEDAGAAEYKASLGKLENEAVNIVLLAGQDASDSQMVTALQGHLNTTAEIKRERIGVLGSGKAEDVNAIAGHTLSSDRLIFVAPGIKVSSACVLPGGYTAAAVGGVLSSLQVHASPTNKVVNLPELSSTYSAPQLEKLVMNHVCAVEKRDGFRIVKGITTSTNSAWHQITTRRIVDYAIAGVRSGANPYIGKLNNERVRSALKATLDAFLTRMVQEEKLVTYELTVTATRRQEIDGEAIVTMTVRPTFSIDFVKVTMYLG